jgi:hypothetical protein
MHSGVMEYWNGGMMGRKAVGSLLWQGYSGQGCQLSSFKFQLYIIPTFQHSIIPL